MKRIITLLILISTQVFAQPPPHQAVVTWSTPPDVTPSSTYNLYRANATCPASGIGTLTWSKVNGAPIAALTYTDSTITAGQWCFYATQVQGALESQPSNTGGGTALPGSPNISVTIN